MGHSSIKNRPEQIAVFDPKRVRPFAGQPRKHFAGIEELASSIKEVGQICPGLVTRISGDKRFDAQLVDGERRLRACKTAGVKFRAEIIAVADDKERFAISFASNFGKQEHNAMEIANGLQRLRDAGKTLKQIAAIAGASDGWVTTYLRFLKLNPRLQKLMTEFDGNGYAKLKTSVADELASTPDDFQSECAALIEANPYLTLREIRRLRDKRDKSNGTPREIPSPALWKLRNVLGVFADRIRGYVDMPGADFREMIEKDAASVRSDVVAELTDLRDSFDGLIEILEKKKANVCA
jgi:ParB/RepB/Spo0J family partition protein